MNALLQKLEETFQTRQRSDADQYWSMINDPKASPDALMTVADRLGKNLGDIRQDAELIIELNSTPKPDEKKLKSELVKLRSKRQKISDEIAKMRALIQAKSLELDTLSAATHVTQAEYNSTETAYKTLIKALSARGYPQAVAEIESATQAKQEAREQRLYERRESDLLKEIAQTDRDVAHLEKQGRLSDSEQAKLSELKSKRAKLDAQLTELREAG